MDFCTFVPQVFFFRFAVTGPKLFDLLSGDMRVGFFSNVAKSEISAFLTIGLPTFLTIDYLKWLSDS